MCCSERGALFDQQQASCRKRRTCRQMNAYVGVALHFVKKIWHKRLSEKSNLPIRIFSDSSSTLGLIEVVRIFSSSSLSSPSLSSLTKKVKYNKHIKGTYICRKSYVAKI